jgi:hypothetical protein
MALSTSPVLTHPAGERVFAPMMLPPAWPVDTPGGRYYAELDLDAPVTREGQLIFFAQFLQTGGLWERLLKGCPLRYEGNRTSGVTNVVGAAALLILCGHWRYAHINAVRGDTLNPPLLGLSHVVSEDVVRRAMKRIEEGAGLGWLSGELRASVEPVLSQPWILDIDVTVKPLYGHQQGAQIGHNPHKPGRPSHADHSSFMANTRLCLAGRGSARRQGARGPARAAGALVAARGAAAHALAGLRARRLRLWQRGAAQRMRRRLAHPPTSLFPSATSAGTARLFQTAAHRESQNAARASAARGRRMAARGRGLGGVRSALAAERLEPGAARRARAREAGRRAGR